MGAESGATAAVATMALVASLVAGGVRAGDATQLVVGDARAARQRAGDSASQRWAVLVGVNEHPGTTTSPIGRSPT